MPGLQYLHDESSCSTLIFDIVKLESAIAFDGFTMEKLTLDEYHDVVRNQLRYKLRTLVPAENMKRETHTVSVSHPKTWWDAFKVAYFPQWLVDRYPVDFVTKEDTVTFTAYNLYPKFPHAVECGDSWRQIIMKTVETRGGDYD